MKGNLKSTMDNELNNIRNIYYQVKNEHYGRVGHRIISSSHKVLIFGGVNAQNQYNTTTMKLDCETMTVDLVTTKNALKLQGFSLFTYNNEIFIWGGSGPYPQNPKMSICTNSMLKFTGDSFIAVEQRGAIPCPRQYHASCMFRGKYLIIMGGNNGKQFFNDWHLLDFSNMEWSKVTVKTDLPPLLNSLIFWKGGRGFLMTGQSFVKQKKELMRENKLYSFRFSDFKAKILELQELPIEREFKQRNPRGNPVGVLAGLQSLYIILVGGEIYKEGVVVTFSQTIDCLNVETLQWHAIELAPQAACSFEALYLNQKIYLVGGIAKNKEINQYTEFIDLKVDYIEAKICKVCRQLYGLRELPHDRSLNIKFEAQNPPRTFFNCDIISRMASYITYPFSALGLLIDNSLNLSASNIEIFFGQIGTATKQPQLFLKPEAIVPYNYIAIYDNSFGFSQNQILECLSSFTVKTEKYTSDKRYEQQIEIRKQYGINLKLGALRLGKSCLYTTKTQDNSRLVAYFSCSYEVTQQFSIFSYFLYSDGTCSSQVNRRIISQNVCEKVPGDYERPKTTTAIYIFDLNKKQLAVTQEQGNIAVYHQQSTNKIFRSLTDYLQSLYLMPFTGRKININQKETKCRNYCEIFRKDEYLGKIMKISEEPPKEVISICNIYRVVDPAYFLRSILFYHKNRLVFVMSKQQKFCGVVQINQRINIDLCKTKIENRSEQIIFLNGFKAFLLRQEERRIPEPVVLPDPSKSKDFAKSPILQPTVSNFNAQNNKSKNVQFSGEPKKT